MFCQKIIDKKFCSLRKSRTFVPEKKIINIQRIKIMAHVIGEVHPNGKWVWTEYKKGKFDWRIRKTETQEVEEKEVIATSPKVRTKKQFIAETNRNLTKEECEEYWKMGKHPDWRPLGYYSFSTRGWSGEYLQIEGYIQDWSEIRKISDTESFTVTLMKHPHQ